MKQIATKISTYSADVMGVCSALFELGGMTIMHDASGCNSTYTTHDEPRWYDMDSMVYISGISEMEAIMGDDEKLIGDIVDAAEELKPAFIAIAGTPIPTMTGFDFEAVADVVEQRTGIPSFGFPTTGMNTYIHGASMALAGIAERFVKAPTGRSMAGPAGEKKQTSDADRSEAILNSEKKDRHTMCRDVEASGKTTESIGQTGESLPLDDKKSAPQYKVNILGLTPLDFSVNGTDASICEWLGSEGFEIVSRWAMGSDLEELAMAGEADINLVVSASGFGAAKVLYERFGMPYAVGFPVGNELPGLMADNIRIKLKEFEELRAARQGPADFEASEISICSELFGDGSTEPGGPAYEEGFVAVIGEGVTSLSLASAIELETNLPAKVLCATECPDGILRDCDRMTPDEDDIIPELAGAKAVIADPLYRPIVPDGVKFVSLPSEAFSGRIYRDRIPDLTANADAIISKI